MRHPRSRLLAVLGERGELDQLLANDEAGATDLAVGEADLPAHADPVTLADAGAKGGVKERLGDVRVDGAIDGGSLEGIQRVALDERAMQGREDGRAADVVDDRRLAGKADERTDLIGPVM